MTPRITIVVANPKPESRTRRVAESLVLKLFGSSQCDVQTIELGVHAHHIFDGHSEEVNSLTDRVARSHVVVFASPTYKATYSGLLKAFLDRYPTNGLAGVTAIPLQTGAGLEHSMGPTFNLAPLLMELGALVPGRGFYFAIQDMERLDEVVQAEAEQYAFNLRQLACIGAILPNTERQGDISSTGR